VAIETVDNDTRVTIEYLRAQAPDGVVRWASDHITATTPWTTGWIDVSVARGGPVGMGWVWTIVGHDDLGEAAPGQLWYFAWPYDLDVHAILDPAEGWYVDELPARAGRELPRALVSEYEEHAQRVGGSYVIRRGWSARAISEALSVWATRHAERGDLLFQWDREAGPSAALATVMERAAGSAPMWDLGDGLTVVDGAMEDLLTLPPDDAAEIMAVLRDAARARRRGTPPGEPR
jgi:hypothetical protein